MKLAVCCIYAAFLIPVVAGQVELAWNPNAPEDRVDYYVVYEKVGSNLVWAAQSVTNRAFVKGVSPGTHCYCVTAVNRWGHSSPSNEDCAVLPGGSVQDPDADTEPPVSWLDPLPPESYAVVPLSWGGSDNAGGSGVASYDLYVSVNGGPYWKWLEAVTFTTAEYFGTEGSWYGFFVVATDREGNKSPLPLGPQAATEIVHFNSPPSLDSPPVVTANVGDVLCVANVASDPDRPAQSLEFALETGAELGARVDAATGKLFWKPHLDHAGESVMLGVRVMDDGLPRLSASRAIEVRVNHYAEFRIGTNVLVAGDPVSVPLNLWLSQPAGQAVGIVQVPGTLLAKLTFAPSASLVCDYLVMKDGASTWMLWLDFCKESLPQGSYTLGHLEFLTAPNAVGFAEIDLANSEVYTAGGEMFPKTGLQNGRVILVTMQPLMELQVVSAREAAIHLYGMPGVNYLVERWMGGLGEPGGWSYYDEIWMDSTHHTFSEVPLASPGAVFRARVDPDWSP